MSELLRPRKNRRREIDVRDKPLEARINLNTVFTALMLGVMSWVGLNIENIKNKVSDFSTALAVTQRDVETLRKDVDRHERDLDSRSRRHQ